MRIKYLKKIITNILWKSLFTTSSIQNRMPSKIKNERRRYIAFRIHSPRIISRNEFIAAIREHIPSKEDWDRMKPWLTVFENNEGILRCVHTNKDKATSLLTSIKIISRDKIPIKVETLGISGTIKKAKRNYLSKENRK
jgi:RNase P/RNase MRP subunit POP5